MYGENDNMNNNEKNIYYVSGTPHKLETPVLMIFFNRPEQFEKVFNAVRQASPRILYLYQDGARKNKNDEYGINKCREILKKIDWDCEVHNWFRKENCGCDPSEYLSQKWVFSEVEKCIVLEDDDVPNQSFFLFCEDMLNKYENDERVNIICGMNHLGEYNKNNSDYFFSTICSIWGWASWSRVVNKWTSYYEFIQDSHTISNLKFLDRNTHIREVLTASEKHCKSGIAYYETILASDMFLNHRLNIIPSKNLISNIGIAASSTHSADSIKKLPHGIRRVFNMSTYELDFPLQEPKYMVEDIVYQKKVKRILGWGHPLVKIYRKCERAFLMIWHKIFKL